MILNHVIFVRATSSFTRSIAANLSLRFPGTSPNAEWIASGMLALRKTLSVWNYRKKKRVLSRVIRIVGVDSRT
jgi:hypothetical protein